MREETTKERIVRTTTTGYIEADMLGHTLNVAEEMKDKQNTSQRPHRPQLKDYTFMSRSEVAKMIYKGTSTAPSACWRRLKALISFSNRYGRKLASLMRRKRINGK